MISMGSKDARRFEAFTRYSFYLMFPVVHAAAGLSEHAGPPHRGLALSAAIAAALGAHLVGSLALSRSALHEQAPARPWWIAYGVATLALVVFLVALRAPEHLRSVGAGVFWPPLMVLGAALAVVGLCLPPRRLTLLGAAGTAFVAMLLLLRGLSWPDAATVLAPGALVVAALAAMGPLTRWMLDVVRALADSRATHARLAVAEERLRFSRDLHDVYGRTLSAIALKSELAAELSRRGDDRAVGEMQAVRDLAQTSLTQVRGIVAGYRQIDPETELAGARSVLRSAGARLVVDGIEPALAALDEQGRTAFAWVLREGTTNVLRHSTATTVSVSAVVDERHVRARLVNDGVDGRGAPGRDGTGLLGLGERLASVGGTLERSVSTETFTLCVTLPRPSSLVDPVAGGVADAPETSASALTRSAAP